MDALQIKFEVSTSQLTLFNDDGSDHFVHGTYTISVSGHQPDDTEGQQNVVSLTVNL